MTHSPVMRLTTTIPAEMPGAGQPLVAFGRTGHGTLLFLRPTGPGQWNLCLDEWGFASPPAVVIASTSGSAKNSSHEKGILCLLYQGRTG